MQHSLPPPHFTTLSKSLIGFCSLELPSSLKGLKKINCFSGSYKARKFVSSTRFRASSTLLFFLNWFIQERVYITCRRCPAIATFSSVVKCRKEGMLQPCVILKVQHHTVHVKQMTREQTKIELQDITVTS